MTRVWDVSADGPPEWEALAPSTGTPNRPRISPDGSQVAVATREPDGFELLDIDTGETLASLTDIEVFPDGPVVSPDWRYLGSLRGSEAAARATIRDLASPQLEVVKELPPCTSVKAFSPDSSLVLLNGIGVCNEDPPAGAELRSRVVEVESGREVLDLGETSCLRGCSTRPGQFPAGRYVAVTDDCCGPVNIYDLEKGEKIATLNTGDMGITAQFDPSFRPSRQVPRRWHARRHCLGARLRRSGRRGSAGRRPRVQSGSAHRTSLPTPRLPAMASWQPPVSTRWCGSGTSTPTNSSSSSGPSAASLK